MEEEQLLEKISINVIEGRIEKEDEGMIEEMVGEPAIKDLMAEAIDKNIDVSLLIATVRKAMDTVGEKFEHGDYYLPEMLASAETVSVAMDMLDPIIAKSEENGRGTIVLATVKGDIHDIGKNIVSIIFKGAGWKVIDLGADVPPNEMVEAAKKEGADAIGMSALLTTTMVAMEDTIKALEAAGVRDRVKVLVGGAPITEEFAEKIGADHYCHDAFAGVAAVN